VRTRECFQVPCQGALHTVYYNRGRIGLSHHLWGDEEVASQMGSGFAPKCIELARALRESATGNNTNNTRDKLANLREEIIYRQGRAKARVLRDLKPYDVLTEPEDTHAAQATHLLGPCPTRHRPRTEGLRRTGANW